MMYLWWAVLILWGLVSIAGVVALTADFIAGREYDWPEEEEA